MLSNHLISMPYPMHRSRFQQNVSLAHSKFQTAADQMKNDPPLAQKNMAEGLQDLTEAIEEIGLKLNLQG
jgi:hypothetical protein